MFFVQVVHDFIHSDQFLIQRLTDLVNARTESSSARTSDIVQVGVEQVLYFDIEEGVGAWGGHMLVDAETAEVEFVRGFAGAEADGEGAAGTDGVRVHFYSNGHLDGLQFG